MKIIRATAILSATMALATVLAAGQNFAPQPDPNPLNSRGQVVLDGRSTPYLVRHLPVSSFPDLPQGVQAELEHRGCLIPQTYEAHHPENAVHGSFEKKGSSDWSVLCSERGTVSLLVFFASRDPGDPFVVASAPETERLHSHIGTSTLGFDWAIDRASPQQVHDAQASLPRHPAPIDHDALADSTVEGRTIYHFYAKSAWTLLDVPQP